MIVNVKFKSNFEIGDEVYYDKPDYYSSWRGKIINIRFIDSSHKFDYLIEEPDGTRSWLLENYLKPILKPNKEYNKLMGVLYGTTK